MKFPINIKFAITEDAYPELLDFLQSHATTDDGYPHINLTVGCVTTAEKAAELAAAEPRMPEARPWDYLDFEVKAPNATFAERLTQNHLLYFQDTLLQTCRDARVSPQICGLKSLAELGLDEIHAFCQAMTKGAYAEKEKGVLAFYMQYPTPDNAETARSALQEYGLSLDHIFLMKEPVGTD